MRWNSWMFWMQVELLDVAELLPALEALGTLRQHGSEETCRPDSLGREDEHIETEEAKKEAILFRIFDILGQTLGSAPRSLKGFTESFIILRLVFPFHSWHSLENFAKFKRIENWDHRYFLPHIVVPTKSPIFHVSRAASAVLALLGKGPSLVQLLLSRSDLRKGQALRWGRAAGGQVTGTVHWFSWSYTCWNCWNLPWYTKHPLLYTHLTSLSLHLRWSKVYLLVFYFFLSRGWFQSSNLQSAWRLLGALAFFPELLGSERSGSCSPCVALCLARLSGVRYGRDAVVDQETAVLWRRRMMRDDGSLFFAVVDHGCVRIQILHCTCILYCVTLNLWDSLDNSAHLGSGSLHLKPMWRMDLWKWQLSSDAGAHGSNLSVATLLICWSDLETCNKNAGSGAKDWVFFWWLYYIFTKSDCGKVKMVFVPGAS